MSNGTNPIIQSTRQETLDALHSYCAHVAESFESPENMGPLISMQLICDAIAHLKLDQ